ALHGRRDLTITWGPSRGPTLAASLRAGLGAREEESAAGCVTLPELELDRFGAGQLDRDQRLTRPFERLTRGRSFEYLFDFFVFAVGDTGAVRSPFGRDLDAFRFGDEFNRLFVLHFVRGRF